MTNFELYKTAKELRDAQAKFCLSQLCETCPHREVCGLTDFQLAFAYAEYEEPKPKKRRPYTYDEAVNLIGKKLEWTTPDNYLGGGHRHTEFIAAIDEAFDVKNDDGKVTVVDVNHHVQAHMIKFNATIDGEPFGVEVTE